MDVNPNLMQVDEEQMDDEQFLAHQMYLAGLENQNPIHIGNRINNQLHGHNAHPVNNQLVPQTVNNQAAQPPVNNQVVQPAANNQAAQQAGNNQADQQPADHQDGQVVNNQLAQQNGDQVVQQAGGQRVQQLGNQVRNLGGPAGDNINQHMYNWQNLDFGNQPQFNLGRGILRGYPQGHPVYGHQGFENQNLRNPVGLSRQRLLSPVEITRANRLKTIIDNLEFELEKNRQMYRILYGNIPGDGGHDAG